MNHWLAEELIRVACAERQRELEDYYLQVEFSALQVKVNYTTFVALKLSDWLIAAGESLRQRYEKNTSVPYRVSVQKFAR